MYSAGIYKVNVQKIGMVRRPFDALFRVVLRVTSYEKSKQLAS
jgi:hypothetical protein